MIRIAAAGDLHFGVDSAGSLRPALEGLPDRADLLLLAGDLTKRGRPEEAEVLAEELRDLDVPIVAALGNHDFHVNREDDVRDAMEEAGCRVLDGEAVTVKVGETVVGVAGIKGFGGGFAGASGSDFGEPEMKAFIRHTQGHADRLRVCLEDLDADLRVALLHYSPIRDTLEGEPPEIYPFLGSYLLAEAVDAGAADLAIHGHAHRGVERGETPGGVPVRNVAQTVLGRAYAIYHVEPDSDRAERSDGAARERSRA